jgi:nucleoside-diphosphate-sugar epimerase
MLVTGASGFLGAALCRLLQAHGAIVHGVSRTPRNSPGVSRWWVGSLSDFAFVRGMLEEVRPSLIFHLAGAVTGVRDLQAVLPTYEGNLTSTVNLLAAAAEIGCGKVVMAGSLEEPDDPHQPPSSPYAASKAAAYAYARLFQALYGVSVIVPRVFIVYGPGQDDRKKLIPYVVSSLLKGESPKLSSGTRAVDWVYVDDVAEGLIAASGADSGAGRVDIGSGRLVTVRELVEKIAALIPDTNARPLFGALPDRAMEQVKVADLSAAAKLGWAPRTHLDDGLKRTVGWLRERFA